MKLLHIITSLRTGGAEKLLLDSIPFYVELGLEVDVLLLNGCDSIFLDSLKKKNNCHIYSLSNNSVYNPFLIFKIIPFFKKYDIIHTHLFPTLYLVALAKCLSRNSCKFIYTEHSTHNRRREKVLLRPLEKFIYNRFDKIIAISKHTKRNLLEWIGHKNEPRVEMIENGINLSKYAQAIPYNRKSLKISLDTKIILMTARLSIQKDHYTLIRAFAKLSDMSSCLILIGDGPLKNSLVSFTKELGVEDRVFFLGIREDVPELIKMADICVLSSNWEGFGLVAVEYMAAGKPTLASDVECLRDIVKDAGILFEKGNDDDLKNKMAKLFSDNSYYKHISKRCYDRSLDFGLDKMVNSYIKIYKEILNHE